MLILQTLPPALIQRVQADHIQWNLCKQCLTPSSSEVLFHTPKFSLKGIQSEDQASWTLLTELRSGIKKNQNSHTCFLVNFSSNLLKKKKQLFESCENSCKCCHFVSSILCMWPREQCQHMWQKINVIMSHPFFCSSLVKSDPTWLHPGELKFKAKNELLKHKH